MPRTKTDFSSPERPRRVTLQDIADVAGVKKMVVSNALNNTRSVAPATREKVLRIAKEMNYIPNFAARALTTGRTGIIAVLTGPIYQPYYANMLHLLFQQIQSGGFNVMVMRTPEKVKELLNATGNIAVDGAIAVDMLGLVGEFGSTSNIPCVSIATIKRGEVDHVLVDLTEGVEEAADIMVAAGRRRIAYAVTASTMGEDTEVRARAYFSSMRKAGQVPEIINVDTNNSWEVEGKFKAYIETNGCPDGLLCQNDDTAMSAFRVFRELGLRIPEDVLLVGCDGQPHMRDFTPPLSTIMQPMEEMCDKAWQFLQQRMAEPDLPHQEAIFPGKLVVRESLRCASENYNAIKLTNSESV